MLNQNHNEARRDNSDSSVSSDRVTNPIIRGGSEVSVELSRGAATKDDQGV